jgi:signal transduction histidine kinase/ligand-binding sensor domain-containing protein
VACCKNSSEIYNESAGVLALFFQKSRTYLKPALLAIFLYTSLLQISPGTARASLAPDKPIHQFMVQNWQSAQGLPQNSVSCITQTPDGHIWLGTEEGIARFDGVRFTTFNRQNSGLDHNIVQSLLVDKKGTLWAGTQGGGLNRFNGERFSTVNASGIWHNAAIKVLFEDAQGVLWIGTDGGGLVRMQGTKFAVFDKSNGLPDNSVFAVVEDKAGNLWVGTTGGLSRLSSGHFTSFSVKDGLPSNFVHTIKVDRHGDIWVGTTGGLSRISAGGITKFTTKDSLKNNNVYSIFEDRAGTLWVGTEAGGLHRFIDGKPAPSLDDSGFLGKDIWSIFEDREGSLWVGTGGDGLVCLKQGLFTTLTRKDGLPSNTILPVLEDTEGNLWIGSDGGLTKREKNRTTVITTKDGLPHNMIISLAEDRNGALWVGTRHGLAQIKANKITTFKAESGLPNDFIHCIYVDRAGTVWIGTRVGLSRFDGQKFITYTTKDGLSNSNVQCIQEDRSGALWIGTFGGGIDRFQGGVFQAYTTRNGLSSDIVNAIYCDREGVLWLATNSGGLNRLKAGKIDTFSTSGDIYKDPIFEILEGSEGDLWVSSNKGVFRYSKKQLNNFAEGLATEISAAYYDTVEGMGSRECNGGFQPAGFKGKNGRLYFPTAGGLAFTDPNAAIQGNSRLQTVLERIIIDGNNYSTHQPLMVPPGKGRLEFQFTAPSFIAPEKLRFEYMLEGFDKDWMQVGNQRTAYYTNIPHGEYRFLVRTGDDRGWKSEASTDLISIRPHFYETTAFYLLILIGVFSTCGAAYRIRMNQVKQREQKLRELVDERTAALRESERQLRHSRDELEIRVQERTQELTHANRALGEEIETRRKTEEQLTVAKEAAEAASRAKSDFLANISHEIRTPLNGILGMTDITLSTDLDDEQKEYLGLVKFSADSLLKIVNDILDFSKIDEHQVILGHAPFELRTVVDELSHCVRAKAQEKNLAFDCRLSRNLPHDLTGDSARLRQILLNLLDNAIKFTSQGGIVLSAFTDGQRDGVADLHFTVQDTGIGISEDQQKSIFEAFSQADTSSTRRYGGTGIGLTISHQLATLMGGKLWVDSKLGEGSTFHLVVRFTVDAGIQETGAGNEPAALVTA